MALLILIRWCAIGRSDSRSRFLPGCNDSQCRYDVTKIEKAWTAFFLKRRRMRSDVNRQSRHLAPSQVDSFRHSGEADRDGRSQKEKTNPDRLPLHPGVQAPDFPSQRGAWSAPLDSRDYQRSSPKSFSYLRRVNFSLGVLFRLDTVEPMGMAGSG